MLSEEQLARYRQMTPGERLAVTLEMLEDNYPYLFRGPNELVDRRFQLLNRQNAERTRNMLKGLGLLRHDSH